VSVLQRKRDAIWEIDCAARIPHQATNYLFVRRISIRKNRDALGGLLEAWIELGRLPVIGNCTILVASFETRIAAVVIGLFNVHSEKSIGFSLKAINR
jgi:hypothetical protein